VPARDCKCERAEHAGEHLERHGQPQDQHPQHAQQVQGRDGLHSGRRGQPGARRSHRRAVRHQGRACGPLPASGTMSEKSIKTLRSEIDTLDDELLRLLTRRMGLARDVGRLKGKAPAYRPERESEILRRMPDHARGVFREVISACRAVEQEIRVAYLGPQGTFSEQAVRQHFGHAVAAEPAASIDEAFRSAESGATQFAVAPVENSTDGAVGRTLDLLLTTPLRICGEVDLRVKQNLLSRAKGMKDIRKIYSHAQSLAQCNGWLGQKLPTAERIPVGSNAEAARRAANEKGAAAIA